MTQIVGFVGSTVSMTSKQLLTLTRLLRSLDFDLFHTSRHDGADGQARALVMSETDARIVVHKSITAEGDSFVNQRVSIQNYGDDLEATSAVLAASELVLFLSPPELNYNAPCRTVMALKEAAHRNKQIMVIRENGEMIRYD